MVIFSDTENSDDEDDEDLTSYYTIKTVNEKKSRIFRAQGKEFQLNIKTFPDNVPHLQFIPRLFDWLVEDIKERCQMESNDKMLIKVSNGAKIRNRYNQVPHLTQDTNGKVTNSQKTPQTRAKRSALSQQ